MPSFTKRAIVESFLHVAAKKPLEKITVRDIVDDCGVNRNTFYYYFQDIYAVLEEICHEAFDKLPEGEPLDTTLLAFFDLFVQFSQSHPRVLHSLLISQGYDGLERYLAADLDRRILACLTRAAAAPSTPSLQKTATVLVRHAFFCTVLTWLREERSADAEEIKRALAQILRAVEASVISDKT